MEAHKLEQANALIKEIKRLTNMQNYAYSNKLRIGINDSDSAYSAYFMLLEDTELTTKITDVIKVYVGAKLPLLQAQLNDL